MKEMLSQNVSLKFHVKYFDLEDSSFAGEWLWGRWLDRGAGLVVVLNNAFEVPLLVTDIVRVALAQEGHWQMVEPVRLSESMATWTEFQEPVTPREAIKVYDGWVRDGYAVHTEGSGGLMVTAWQDTMELTAILQVLGPVFANAGWKLWHIFEAEDRLSEIQHRVDLGLVAS